jgi:hypothetical protein
MASHGRAERRRNARAEARRADRIAWHGLGDGYEVSPSEYHARRLPDKPPGEHRWIAIASFTVTRPSQVEGLQILDRENLWHVGIGCVDCETPWTPEAERRPCPGPTYVEPEL